MKGQNHYASTVALIRGGCSVVLLLLHILRQLDHLGIKGIQK